ncbi:MAG: monovalent cation/H+ antiporter complex subunit F [Actinomycetota bacterium]|nr:monovalent cation/H+ antiporter complex subunit F [Actinomycetota bacterium]
MSFIDATLIVMCAAFGAGLVRVIRGPSLADRVAAADVCLFAVVAALPLLGLRQGSEVFVDAVLVATLLGFVATVSLARLVERKKP